MVSWTDVVAPLQCYCVRTCPQPIVDFHRRDVERCALMVTLSRERGAHRCRLWRIHTQRVFSWECEAYPCFLRINIPLLLEPSHRAVFALRLKFWRPWQTLAYTQNHSSSSLSLYPSLQSTPSARGIGYASASRSTI